MKGANEIEIRITGPDGSGKTILIQAIKALLRRTGSETGYYASEDESEEILRLSPPPANQMQVLSNFTNTHSQMNSQSQINDGGPAFPKTGSYHEDVDAKFDSYNQDGMTLRDWFAGQVLVGICSDAERFWDGAAPLAYQYADAMIAARNQPNK